MLFDVIPQNAYYYIGLRYFRFQYMDFSEYISRHREQIRLKIFEYFRGEGPPGYSEIIRDYSERQGKYVRPGLLMITGQMLGAKSDELIIPAAAMQLSEDWILIHDDIEDDSEMRRGKPALHKIYGCEHAINAGDGAHLLMWQMLRDYLEEYGIKRGLSLFDMFSKILTATVEGQYLDIDFAKRIKEIGKADEKMYYGIVERKTSCYSVYGPMQLGATVAGADQKILDLFKKIGIEAGNAFQIMDDVLDFTADEKSFGKKKYGDLYEGKLTLIALHAYKEASAAEKRRIDKIFAKSKNSKTNEDIDFLIEMIEKYKSADYAYSIAMKHGAEAKRILDENRNMLPDNEFRGIFESSVYSLFNRKK